MDAPLLEKSSALANNSSNRWLYIASAVTGGAYGLALRIMASLHSDFLRVMPIGFIFFMPFALGCIAAVIAEIKRPQPRRHGRRSCCALCKISKSAAFHRGVHHGAAI